MKFTLEDGLLIMESPTGQTTIIEELSMAKYEKFYRHWMVAMGTIQAKAKEDPTLDYTTCYVTDATFRDNMLKALQIAGFENPDHIPPRAMQQLLLTESGQPGDIGLLFKLHGETPKVPPQGPPTPPAPKKKGIKGFLRGLTNSMSVVTSQALCWVNQGLSTSGLYALC